MSDGAKLRALVIDDSRAMRAILRRALRPHGFDVVQAGDGQEGLDQLADAGMLDLVLVDWNMPVMDGLTFVRRFRELPQYADVPVMMVTTETDRESIVAALDAGANDYLMKPFDAPALAGKLASLGFDANGAG